MGSASNSTSTSLREVAERRVIMISSYLRVGTWILLSASIFMMLYAVAASFWFATTPNDFPLLRLLITAEGPSFTSQSSTVEYSQRSNLLSLAYMLVVGLFFIYCIVKLHLLFGNFHNNKIFTQKNSKLLRSLGYAFVVGALLGGFLNSGYFIAIAFIENPDWSNINTSNLLDLRLGLSTKSIQTFLSIGLVFLSAWILDIGRELYTEAELTI